MNEGRRRMFTHPLSLFMLGPGIGTGSLGRGCPAGSQWQCTECKQVNRDAWKRCDGCQKPRSEVERT